MSRTVSERRDVLPALAEVFREHGFDGASLALIEQRTGLGKGSLYHFFPGGKHEMAEAVLEDVHAWFEHSIFRPLRQDEDARRAVRVMFAATDTYFRSGRRVCLVGAFALGDARERFAGPINAYFAAWRDALAAALRRAGVKPKAARARAEETVAGIQGALVAARALDDRALFGRMLKRLEARLDVH